MIPVNAAIVSIYNHKRYLVLLIANCRIALFAVSERNPTSSAPDLLHRIPGLKFVNYINSCPGMQMGLRMEYIMKLN